MARLLLRNTQDIRIFNLIEDESEYEETIGDIQTINSNYDQLKLGYNDVCTEKLFVEDWDYDKIKIGTRITTNMEVDDYYQCEYEVNSEFKTINKRFYKLKRLIDG